MANLVYLKSCHSIWICNEELFFQACPVLTHTPTSASAQPWPGMLLTQIWLKFPLMVCWMSLNLFFSENTIMAEEEAALAQSVSHFLRVWFTVRQPQNSLSPLHTRDLLPPIEINTAILSTGISLEPRLQRSNNPHIRRITCLFIIDMIDIFTLKILFQNAVQTSAFYW